MQRVAISILLLIVAVGVYILISGSEDDSAGRGTPSTGNGDGSKGGDRELKGAKAPDPERLKPRQYALATPANVLLIGRWEESFNDLLLIGFEGLEDLGWRTWYEQSSGSTQRGPHAGRGTGMRALDAPPTGSYLKDEDVRALFVDGLDPNAYPLSFWNVVAERVKAGKMGLYVRPGLPIVEGKLLPAHPVLSHAVLKDLLPVKSAASLAADPIPGQFSADQLFAVTAEGESHPATRLTVAREGSAAVWKEISTGKGAFATSFVYPVQDLTPDAKVLLNIEAATSLPAVIAGAPADKGRVLWMGAVGFGRAANFTPSKDTLQKTLVNHWIVWLVGQGPK